MSDYGRVLHDQSAPRLKGCAEDDALIANTYLRKDECQALTKNPEQCWGLNPFLLPFLAWTETKRLGLGHTARGDDLVRIEHAVQAALDRIDESAKEAILRAFAIKNKFLPHKTSENPKYVNGENATKPLFGVVLAISESFFCYLLIQD